MAKEPRPGAVKTRLCPPCTPAEAATVAEAALADTMASVLACHADRRVVALAGEPGPWLPEGIEVISQGDGGFDRRLAIAWQAMDGPGIQIGMDTPHISGPDLDDALGALEPADVDAVLGPAADGGWWVIGLQSPDPRVFLGVETSRTDTGRRQLQRLTDLGLRADLLATHRDLDTVADAVALAIAYPDLATSRVVTALGLVDALAPL